MDEDRVRVLRLRRQRQLRRHRDALVHCGKALDVLEDKKDNSKENNVNRRSGFKRLSLSKKSSSGSKRRSLFAEEGQILARVNELKQQGLWTPDKLLSKPSSKAPGSQKAHWDFLLEEMNWLSSVIRQEAKTRKTIAKKCARMVQKHFDEKESLEIRLKRQLENQRRKIASTLAKDVRQFWTNIDKLYDFKLQSEMEIKRKRALDDQLDMIVNKTEKFSIMMAESMKTNHSSVSNTPRAVSEVDDTECYQPDEDEVDDEATITVDDDKNEEGEIDDLERESQIPIEQLLKKFHPELYSEESSKDDNANKGNGDIEIDENLPLRSSTTVSRSGRRRRRPRTLSEKQEVEASKPKKEIKLDKNTEEDASKSDLKSLLADDDSSLYEALETAEQFRPTGNTLATTLVKTPVPFLLKHTLREYQHIGLDWLVSLHERNFNGILADEMGLGKTIQTIAVLAHEATAKGNWGPHLIVVPTSVMLNWEMEVKKWCPAFKVLVYYGSQKERKQKRVGWTKKHSFHVCITSYKLVVQDHSSFRRKQWYYLVLDEAQHIKNFRSQRWQLLLNFQSKARLLLTGTPLQNHLMELWSLMHFLMPKVFQSHANFKEWFSNPLTGMVEDSAEYNEQLVKRLHKVLRPFLLRRLKREVEKQLPHKYEHVVYCSLSKRQRYLYDDYMSRAKTKETLSKGNFMSVINVLMQLRKVCNHPNLFEPRPIISPFVIEEPLSANCPNIVKMQYDPLKDINLRDQALNLIDSESMTAFESHRTKQLNKRKDMRVQVPVNCPKNKYRVSIENGPTTQKEVGMVTINTVLQYNLWTRRFKKQEQLNVRLPKGTFLLTPMKIQSEKLKTEDLGVEDMSLQEELQQIRNNRRALINNSTENEKEEEKEPVNGINDNGKYEGNRRELRRRHSSALQNGVEETDHGPKGIFSSSIFNSSQTQLLQWPLIRDGMEQRMRTILPINDRRCMKTPIYGSDFRKTFEIFEPRHKILHSARSIAERNESEVNLYGLRLNNGLVIDWEAQLDIEEEHFLQNFHVYVPKALAKQVSSESSISSWQSSSNASQHSETSIALQSSTLLSVPETRLIEYDCGKLQTLSHLLHQLYSEQHRVLIFTQMTKVLDILESFLSYHNYIYLRLDGSTRVEQRQVLMERFNRQSKYFCFILSTRSGGVGINLTGADTVVFYDSDWNPTMDAQAQDRCHRIGQTRDVHIYRLICQSTVEENILKKANQKRMLGSLAIDEGNFSTAALKADAISELFTINENKSDANNDTVDMDTQVEDSNEVANTDGNENVKVSREAMKTFESAIASVEDDTDREALKVAQREALVEDSEFDEVDDRADKDPLSRLADQLTSVEKFALAFMEREQKERREEQLRQLDEELGAQNAHTLQQLRIDHGEDDNEADQVEEGDGDSNEDDENMEDDSDDDEEEEGDSDNDEDEEDDEEEEDDDDDEDEDEDEQEEEEDNEDENEVEETMDDDNDEDDMEAEESVSGRDRRTRSRGRVRIDLWSLDKRTC